MWSQTFLILAVLASAFLLLVRATKIDSLIRIFLTAGLLTLVTGTLMAETNPDQSQFLIGWNQTVGIAFILSALSMVIWHFKPSYTRHPYPFVYLPLLMIPIYGLISDMSVLSELLNQIFQGGAYLIAALLYVTMAKSGVFKRYYLGALVLLLLGYLSYWHVPGAADSGMPVWRYFTGTGTILLAISFSGISIK